MRTADPIRQIFEADYDEWTPPEQLLALLHDKRLRTRDKVELVIGVYAMMHRGAHPGDTKISKILGLSRSRVYDVMGELLIMNRAEKIHGKFVLRFGVYQNPLIADYLHKLGFEPEL